MLHLYFKVSCLKILFHLVGDNVDLLENLFTKVVIYYPNMPSANANVTLVLCAHLNSQMYCS